MKTLLISYLPGGEMSNTKKLYDYFESIVSNTTIEHLDLLKDSPQFFTHESLMAYYSRNYMNKPINDSQKIMLSKMDRYVNQIKDADIVVMAYPMHNFGMPGIVKTWFDSIIAKGETFEYGATGPVGLLKNKKALTLYTSGGTYSKEKVTLNFPELDTLSLLSKIEFSFIGFEQVEVISASTANAATLDENIKNAQDQIKTIVDKWYK